MTDGLSPVDRLEESLHLRDLLRMLLKRKWTILIIFSVSALFSVVLTYLAPPVYRASTTIQIERFSPRVFDFKEVSPSESDYSDSLDFYATNYELLKSRTLAERAVEDIGLRKNPPALGAQEPAKDPSGAEAKLPSDSFLKDFLSRVLNGPAPVEVDPATTKDNAVVGAFQSALTVEPVRKSRLVRLHFDSTDPFFAAKAANTLAQAFININLERRFEASSYAKTFLEEKLLQTKAKLEDSERELVRFSRELQILNIDEKQNVFSQNLQEYNSAVSKAEQERIRAEVIFRQAQENPDSLAVVQENKNIQALKQSKAKLEAEYQDNLKVYKPAFPKMQQMRGQITEVDNQIRGEIEEVRKSAHSNYRAARSQEGMLKERLVEAKRQLLDLQGRTIRYSILKREVDTNRQLYDGLLEKLKEASLAAGLNSSNIRIVDKARVPHFPARPNVPRNMLFAVLLGLVGGVAVAFALEAVE